MRGPQRESSEVVEVGLDNDFLFGGLYGDSDEEGDGDWVDQAAAVLAAGGSLTAAAAAASPHTTANERSSIGGLNTGDDGGWDALFGYGSSSSSSSSSSDDEEEEKKKKKAAPQQEEMVHAVRTFAHVPAGCCAPRRGRSPAAPPTSPSNPTLPLHTYFAPCLPHASPALATMASPVVPDTTPPLVRETAPTAAAAAARATSPNTATSPTSPEARFPRASSRKRHSVGDIAKHFDSGAAAAEDSFTPASPRSDIGTLPAFTTPMAATPPSTNNGRSSRRRTASSKERALNADVAHIAERFEGAHLAATSVEDRIAAAAAAARDAAAVIAAAETELKAQGTALGDLLAEHNEAISAAKALARTPPSPGGSSPLRARQRTPFVLGVGLSALMKDAKAAEAGAKAALAEADAAAAAAEIRARKAHHAKALKAKKGGKRAVGGKKSNVKKGKAGKRGKAAKGKRASNAAVSSEKGTRIRAGKKSTLETEAETSTDAAAAGVPVEEAEADADAGADADLASATATTTGADEEAATDTASTFGELNFLAIARIKAKMARKKHDAARRLMIAVKAKKREVKQRWKDATTLQRLAQRTVEMLKANARGARDDVATAADDAESNLEVDSAKASTTTTTAPITNCAPTPSVVETEIETPSFSQDPSETSSFLNSTFELELSLASPSTPCETPVAATFDGTSASDDYLATVMESPMVSPIAAAVDQGASVVTPMVPRGFSAGDVSLLRTPVTPLSATPAGDKALGAARASRLRMPTTTTLAHPSPGGGAVGEKRGGRAPASGLKLRNRRFSMRNELAPQNAQLIEPSMAEYWHSTGLRAGRWRPVYVLGKSVESGANEGKLILIIRTKLLSKSPDDHTLSARNVAGCRWYSQKQIRDTASAAAATTRKVSTGLRGAVAARREAKRAAEAAAAAAAAAEEAKPLPPKGIVEVSLLDGAVFKLRFTTPERAQGVVFTLHSEWSCSDDGFSPKAASLAAATTSSPLARVRKGIPEGTPNAPATPATTAKVRRALHQNAAMAVALAAALPPDDDDDDCEEEEGALAAAGEEADTSTAGVGLDPDSSDDDISFGSVGGASEISDLSSLAELDVSSQDVQPMRHVVDGSRTRNADLSAISLMDDSSMCNNSSAFETASEPDTPPPTFPASEQRQQAAARAEEAAEAAEPRPPAQSQTSPTTSPMRQNKLDAEALRARWLLRQAAFKERQAAKAVAAEKRATSIAPSHVDVGASLLLAGLSDDLTDSHSLLRVGLAVEGPSPSHGTARDSNVDANVNSARRQLDVSGEETQSIGNINVLTPDEPDDLLNYTTASGGAQDEESKLPESRMMSTGGDRKTSDGPPQTGTMKGTHMASGARDISKEHAPNVPKSIMRYAELMGGLPVPQAGLGRFRSVEERNQFWALSQIAGTPEAREAQRWQAELDDLKAARNDALRPDEVMCCGG